MAQASEKSVLGNFNNAKFTYAGLTSTFLQRDGKFFVNTDGPDGKLKDYEIKYTFGVTPLQQYLIEFPDGRIQPLSIAWDARPKRRAASAGFISIPMSGSPTTTSCIGRARHKTGTSCAPTATQPMLQKNYDPAADRFQTRWAEISVGCEACHGPGSPSGVGRCSIPPFKKGGQGGI